MELSVYCKAFLLSTDGGSDLHDSETRQASELEGHTHRGNNFAHIGVSVYSHNSSSTQLDLLPKDFTYDNESQFRDTDVRI
jgi:hypothetical protein